MVRRRAFTFIEVLVGSALALVVGAIILSILLVGQKWSRKGLEKADYQRMGLVTVNHLMHHLLGAREIMYPIGQESKACCIQGHDFRLHVYAYKPKERILVHHVLDPTTKEVGKAKVLATNLRKLRFSVGENSRRLHVKMVFSKRAKRVKKSEIYELETALAVRN